MKHKNEKIISIQVLRAIAVLMVVFIHTISSANYLFTGKGLFHSKAVIATYYFLADWGAIGVDLFFIISGFIMTRVVAPFESVKNGWKDFILKRVIRIIPYYWLISAVYLVLSIMWHQPVTLQSVLSTLFFFPVFNSFQYISPILFVGWSLSIELYFYLLIAVLLIFKTQNLKIKLVVIMCALTLLGVLVNSNYVIIDFALSPLLFEFALGVILGMFYDRFKGFERKNIAWFFFTVSIVLGAFLMSRSIFIDHKEITLPNNIFSNTWIALRRSLIWGIPCMLFAGGYILLEKSIFATNNLYVKITEPLVLLGNASYTCYLVHIMGIKFFAIIFRYLGISSPDVYIILCTLVCVAASVPVYKYVELPLIKIITPLFYPKREPAASIVSK
ncbi:Peptidoglycan/LPS O-acetylase OafA/YrhL, contains acyltransferase and SGNH-hydrolase domains [Mucilaginibacter gossypiicola]|uniref:Peptidoglycan/LPS O-acetylase OafA/YrhL, contains acyltransferase and SGNH-hydrolase domains n=1 Tax=Mucilaginibacter gossypiicola TaxID=551995 RepID=A0A1H8NAW3_9SPHI|nr:acyltransferase [Mucilaginibacter gossypiicola]SEO26841.1 Peptidoglycan/LPS O-acetylase OafA/YrhL, contains acyltransferase and SGNH-hydrolase domains [Mucilaginibacter gossypiicola]